MLRKVTVLLQIYIIEKTPYQILLGQPFNAITKSWVVNDKEENQTINIICPNTEIEVAFPTYKRGTLPRRIDTGSNFY